MILFWIMSYSTKMFPRHSQFPVLLLFLSRATIHLRPSKHAYLFHFFALLLRLFIILTDSISF